LVKGRRHRSDDTILLPDGDSLTADQLDNASVEMLQSYSDFGLRCLVEECRHWQAMAEIEQERRKSEGME
jgi:hypothetical protein